MRQDPPPGHGTGLAALPWRGDGAVRPALGLPLPPARMPLLHARRPLKRWRYAGIWTERLLICAGSVRIGGVPQAFWAVWDRDRGVLRERTAFRPGRVALPDGRLIVRDRGIEIDLRLDPDGEPVEVVSRHGAAHIWTRKHGLRATGIVRIDGTAIPVTGGPGLIDDSAGYHARETRWAWSAGAGVARGGEAVLWNLVSGLHDAPQSSERTLWIDGVPHEVGPVEFADDLSEVRFAEGAVLGFRAEAERARRDNLGLVSSDYRQPFGSFAGALPRGLEVTGGAGVMERHRARW